jgi:hypothetical protein
MKIRLAFRILVIVFFLNSTGPALGMDNGWYFTPVEIANAYRYQEQFGSRLRHALNPHGCYYGKSEFVASFQGKQFLAPCRFITETTRHLKQMLENGAARYLFPLDADHAHLAVPTELWAGTYSKLSIGEVLPALLREPKLIALYHTAEHLTIADPTNVAASDATAKWRAKRNVLGFFDGRPLKILPPRPDGAAHDKPERYENVGNVYFLGHWLGEIAFSANGKAVSFDMSFNEDSSDAP